MRFDTTQHPLYCGIDLHARTMDVCILDQAGDILLHRTMPATPEALRKAIAPSRTPIVLAAAGMFPWYWLADCGADHGLPCVLGHALSLQAIHRGKAKNDTIDAHTIAVLWRGGMLPRGRIPRGLREPPAAQTVLTRWETKHRQGTALTIVAQPLARAVSSLLPRQTACDLDPFLQG